MSSQPEHWIYHERQEAALCGQHALNNLVQAYVFSPGSLSEIAHQLDEMELTYMANNNEGGVRSKDYLQRLNEGSGNVDAQGNFSIEVLRSALMNQYGLEMPNIRQEGVGDSIETTEIEGFICNKSAHWFAIRKIHGRYWNLNSTLDQPQFISHFHLATEVEALQNEGYSVFVVQNGLPPSCTSAAGTSRGLAQYWWKEEDLLAGKINATTAATDPWRSVGSGMRLDGKTTASESTNSISTDDMTEDEMLQMALMASLTTQTTGTSDEANEKSIIKTLQVAVPPEPPEGTDGAVRIQFRMPDGKRIIRRFLPAECVEVMYAFVEESCPSNGKQLELRYGFPPKDLASKRSMTVTEAHLSGENIQGRHF
jgi:ataxin-3